MKINLKQLGISSTLEENETIATAFEKQKMENVFPIFDSLVEVVVNFSHGKQQNSTAVPTTGRVKGGRGVNAVFTSEYSGACEIYYCLHMVSEKFGKIPVVHGKEFTELEAGQKFSIAALIAMGINDSDD